MNYNDTKYINLEATLDAIGKATFVNFYYDFKDTEIPTDVLLCSTVHVNASVIKV